MNSVEFNRAWSEIAAQSYTCAFDEKGVKSGGCQCPNCGRNLLWRRRILGSTERITALCFTIGCTKLRMDTTLTK